MKQAYIYLLSQSYNVDYNTYDSAVVVARSAKEAKDIWDDKYADSLWAPRRYVKAKRVGIAAKGMKCGVTICASYNAG